MDLSFAPSDSVNNVFRMLFSFLAIHIEQCVRARLYYTRSRGRRTITDPRANFVTDLCDFPCKLSCSPVIMLIKIMTRRVCTSNAAAVMNHGVYRRRRSSHRSKRDTATFLRFPTNSWPTEKVFAWPQITPVTTHVHIFIRCLI